jgi:holin-like protein
LRWFRILLQVAILIGFHQMGEIIQRFFRWPIPGSVIGLIALFLCLKWKWIRLEWIEAGASFLIAELMLFFIPAAVGVVQYQELILQSGLYLLAFIIFSTVLIMFVLGWLADRLHAQKEQREKT